jgi:tetratricopeptide (TPR) repeat protein
MPARFSLIITADHPNRTAEFRLCDEHGAQLAFRPTDFKTVAASHLHGLFDLRNYLRLYVEEGAEVAAVAEIGVCIAEEVLGREIFLHLWTAENQRTLCIQLPGATEEENHLAAALARVPWEIARPSPDQATLAERNLLVRVVHGVPAPASLSVELAPDEALRVLFVFAEARGSSPLGARQERRELLRMLEQEVYPQRRVMAHFLTHGVTRERLEDQVRQNNGYHVVHWSGHGHLNLLELAKPGGASDHLSGRQLLELFTRAGGFLPRLVFLSACHSGDILRVKDWDDFLAVAQGNERGRKHAGTKHADTKNLDLKEQPGFTGTAHALLQGGVPSVVAMRYAVGDDYARELAVEFYRALLAHAQPKNVAAALSLARQAMLDAKQHAPSRFAACDHATPVLYGAEQPGLTLARGRSPDLNPCNPRLHQIAELTTAGHEHFVGRTWELAGLGAEFIGSRAGAEVKPVAVITGLGGMGKTALVAEALALWESRFQWVLLYQAKPNALGFEAFLRDVHLKLMGELKLYHDHVRAKPADAVYRDASAEFTGQERLDRLTRNLVRALKDEPILLVLDNFENNLKPERVEGGSTSPSPALASTLSPAAGERVGVREQPAWPCQDPAWDECLAWLAKELVGSPSRVLITSRRPLAALADGAAHWVQLGPLPPEEAALYLQAHPVLGKMVFDADPKERLLAQRLLEASRFHPLLMDRLARLAAAPTLRPQLLAALETLEKTKDFARLPALFATCPGDAKELAYLEDALAASLDQLIRAASPDARRVLWLIAVANEPVALDLLRSIWSGEDHEHQQLRQIKEMRDMLSQLAPELRAGLSAQSPPMPPEVRAKLDALPPQPLAQPDIGSLLGHLVSVGLATAERMGPEDDNPDFTCHELVRERIRACMHQRPQNRGELTENAIRLAYAQRLEVRFRVLQHLNVTAAFEAGSRALVYCVQAEAWDRLPGFTGGVVLACSNPPLLHRLIPHLVTAAESAPKGKPRWSCFRYLADALSRSGCADTSLEFYAKAAALARAQADAAGSDAREAWSDASVICNNWAIALLATGDPDAARQRYLEAAQGRIRAGDRVIDAMGSELGVLRIDILQGRVGSALPELEKRLTQIQQRWEHYCSRHPVPAGPDAEILACTYISALNIAAQARFALEEWKSAVRLCDDTLEIQRVMGRSREDIAATRMNRAVALGYLGSFGKATSELESCLQVFRNSPVQQGKVLSALALVFSRQGDAAQAVTQERRALARFDQLLAPAERAKSHNNLANYLERHGTPAALAEAPRHQLAALIYRLVARLGQDLQTSQRKYAFDFRQAQAPGIQLTVPQVAQLLADPAFAPLDQWLRERQVNLEELQTAVDQFLDQARRLADTQP